MTHETEREIFMHDFSIAQNLIDANDFDEAKKQLDKCISCIEKNNFWPFMQFLLNPYIKINQHNSDYSGMCLNSFLLMSPLIRCDNSLNAFKMFQKFIDSAPEIDIIVPKSFVDIVPIQIKALYSTFQIIASGELTIYLGLVSKLPEKIKVEDAKLEFTTSTGIITDISFGSFDFYPLKAIHFTRKRIIPCPIKTESISSFIIQFKNVKFHINKSFCQEINVIPDLNDCTIDFILHSKCFIGVKIPFQIKISSKEHPLKNMKFSFLHADPKIFIEISGKCEGQYITFNDDLPDMLPHSSLILDMEILTKSPATSQILFDLSFLTDKSGNCFLEKPLSFDFKSPLETTLNLYDDNFRLLSPKNILVENGSYVLLELFLRNDWEIPFNVLSIQEPNGNLISTDDFFTSSDSNDENNQDISSSGYPILLQPGEEYCIHTKITNPLVTELKINYQTQHFYNNIFSLNIPKITFFNRTITSSLTVPYQVKLFQSFQVNLKLFGQNDNSMGILHVSSNNAFAYKGPESLRFVLNKNEEKNILLDFLPLECGSLILPTITIKENESTNPPKIYILPILVK